MKNYIKIDTLMPLDDHEIRASVYPSILPADFDSELLAELGYAELEFDPEPELAAGDVLQPGTLRREGDRVIQGWEVIPAPPPDWPMLIAARRWQAETGGIIWQGYGIATD